MLKNRIKDYIYDFLVRKNKSVQYEYERYVMEHIEEHHTCRKKHWRILWQLTLHYRIKKETKPLLYSSIAYNQSVGNSTLRKNEGKRAGKGEPLPEMGKAESYCTNQIPPHQFVKKLLNYDVVSFDVFDTLILRNISEMKSVYTLVGERLDCLSFQRIRLRAQGEARRHMQETYGSNEMTLEDIYKIVERKTGIPVQTGMDAEMGVEKDICFANTYMKWAFDILCSFGKKIIVVSDTYMSAEQIKELLEHCGYSGLEKVYVSSEYRCGKHSGELYRAVLEEQGFPRKIIHVGDNPESDIIRARQKGIDAVQYTNVNTAGNRYRCDGMSQLIRSAYRGIVNTTVHSGSNHFSVPYEFGYIYGGIYILGFVNWIHQCSQLRGIDKILFLARDGYVYKKVYDMIYDDIPCEYVYWSRQANMKCAAKYQKDQYILRNVYHKVNRGISIREILEEAKIDFVKSDFEELGMDLNEKLTDKNSELVERILCKNWSAILEAYHEEKEISGKYFRDIIGNSRRIAIVEVGWVGTSQDGLKKLIENEWCKGCEVYCFSASSASAESGDNIVQAMSPCYSSYLFSYVHNSSITGFHRDKNGTKKTILFELFTQACHPSFKGFTIDGNGQAAMEFDLAEVENYEILNEIMKGETDFCANYISAFKKFPILFHIPGYDAYMPFRTAVRKLGYARKHLGQIQIAETVGLNGTEGEMKYLRDLL